MAESGEGNAKTDNGTQGVGGANILSFPSVRSANFDPASRTIDLPILRSASARSRMNKNFD